MANQSDGIAALPKSTVADRISDLVRQLRTQESPLGFGLWDMQTADRRGDVMNAIKGIGGQPKHIKDGYQYVGGFPSHRWRAATADDHYRTLSYGIKQFPKKWQPIRKALDQPYHYVSIGPGTGEKDRIVLQHLQSMPSDETIVYIPIDISADLLRMGIETSMQDVDDDRVEVLPIELDITEDDALPGLKTVIRELTGDSGVLISLLGNTLANFNDDQYMLGQVASLLSSPRDRLFVELATTREASTKTATKAATEYEGSRTFRDFAMAALREYTDLTPDQGHVNPTAKVIDDSVLQITTHFTANKPQLVTLKDGDDFDLAKNEEIELYTSRKYTEEALNAMRSNFSCVAASNPERFRGGGFGITMELLSRRDRGKKEETFHPVTGSQ